MILQSVVQWLLEFNFEFYFCDFHLVRNSSSMTSGENETIILQDSSKESSEEKSDGPGEMAFLRAVGVKSFQAASRGLV